MASISSCTSLGDRASTAYRGRSRRCESLRAALAALCTALTGFAAGAVPRCDADDAGLRLSEGFCAFEVARDLGSVRNLAIAASGDVYAARRADGASPGGVIALRDADGDGRADVREVFGEGDGHGIALTDAHLYYAAHDRVVRWKRQAGALAPEGDPETLVSGFPEQTEHRVKGIALGPDDALYVAVGAPSNNCQKENRSARSPGIDPCPQLALQAGIWLYASGKSDQPHEPARRFATGLRHSLALSVHPETGELWAAVNGRDMLGGLWGFGDERNAALPAEELVRVTRGADFGWPYCYHDGLHERKVLAPEYGGDGEQQGRCADKALPALSLPAHWAPMAIAFYTGGSFPARYRGGAFVAFRGSWNRAPLPQEGFRVSFVPFGAGRPVRFETFAIDAADPTGLRATGVAIGPDGSLYLSSDRSSRIWRVLPEPAKAESGSRPAPPAASGADPRNAEE